MEPRSSIEPASLTERRRRHLDSGWEHPTGRDAHGNELGLDRHRERRAGRRRAPPSGSASTTLTYGELDDRSRPPGDAAARARAGARRPGRGDAAERPRVPDRLLRRAAGGRRRGADERAAETARDRLLPGGLGGEAAARLARLPRGRATRRRRRGRRADRGRAGGLRGDAGRRSSRRAEIADGRRRGHRGDPLHLGHDRQTEGGRALPPQPDPELGDHLADDPTGRPRRRRPRGAAALPHLRPDGRA